MFCDNCEIKIAKDAFEEFTIEELNEKLGNTWEKYGFQKLLLDCIHVSNMEDDDKTNWTVNTEYTYLIYLSQINRLKRIDNYNFKMKMKNRE